MTGIGDDALDGFLAEDVSGWKSGLQSEFAPVVGLARQANRACNRLLYSLQIGRGNLQQVLVAMLYARGLRLYQSAILLSWHCLNFESQVAFRSMLEAQFKACAIADKPELAETYVELDAKHRWQSVQAIQRMQSRNELGFDSEQQAKFEKLSELSRPSMDRGVGDPWWWADQAKMSGVYDSAYVLASSHVHTNPRAIEQALTLDADGDIEDIAFGPTRDDYLDNQMAAVDLILMFAIRVGGSFGHPVDEIERLKSRFLELAKTMNFGQQENA